MAYRGGGTGHGHGVMSGNNRPSMSDDVYNRQNGTKADFDPMTASRSKAAAMQTFPGGLAHHTAGGHSPGDKGMMATPIGDYSPTAGYNPPPPMGNGNSSED